MNDTQRAMLDWVGHLVSAEHECRMGCHHDRHDTAEGDDDFKSTGRCLAGLVSQLWAEDHDPRPRITPEPRLHIQYELTRVSAAAHSRA